MTDTVYFNCNCTPDGKDWMHCRVVEKRDGLVRVAVQYGYNEEYLEFPLTNVLRIKYGEIQRW